MSLYLLYSDPHLADRPPSSCTDTYVDDLFDLLWQTVEIARERRAAGVVCAGDFFHVKAPSRTSHALVNRSIDLIHAYPCPVWIVPGNHDFPFDRLDAIDRQPLGTLFRRGARPLIGWCEGCGSDVHDLYGVPWLQGYGENTEESDGAVYEALRGWREPLPPVQPALVVAHAPLYPPGRELPYEHFPAERWADAMGGHGWCFYGHVHEPHGLYGFYDAESGVTFCNYGALSRGSLHEYNLTRQVGCTLWDSVTGVFEFVPLNAKPAEQVFRLQEKQQASDMQGRVEEFLAGFAGTTLEVLSVESVIEHLRTLGLGADAETLVTELLMEAAHGGK